MPGGPTRCQKTELTFQKSPGKHVFERFVQQDEELGREVCVRFTEGTQLSSAVGVRQIIGARYCNEETTNVSISHKQE
jgi:hypothetical protein